MSGEMVRKSAGSGQVVAGGMRNDDPRGDATAGSELGDQRQAAGLENGRQIIEDAVGDVLVEDAFVAKRLQVQFQALEFHAEFVRDVAERQRSEVGLSRLRAHRRELRAEDLDLVVTAGKCVGEGFQLVAGRLLV